MSCLCKWSSGSIPDLSGRDIIVTGANHGIGFEAAKALALKGAEIVLAVRNSDKGERAAEMIRRERSDAAARVMSLDLASLDSVSRFAADYSAGKGKLDLLINNAGVMLPPYSKTADGFEQQLGINHLGHFALTAHLLPLIRVTPFSRIVTVSSIAARKAKIDFDNLDGSKGYHHMKFYRQSKLANLLFAIELNRRLADSGSTAISVAAHPGISATNILSRGSGREMGRFVRQVMMIVAQTAECGALCTLYAATNPDLRGGEFIGPAGAANWKGCPVATSDGTRLFNGDLSARLWSVSESLTGVKYLI